MSIRDGKAKVDQAVGRVEEVLGQSYADPAAEVHGEALRLRGEAEEDAAPQAEHRLEREAGVVPVRNELDRDPFPRGGPEDGGLRADVLEALMLDPLVPASIDVHVRHGRVTLTGTAHYRYQRDAAEAAARGVAGVVDVRNQTELTLSLIHI